MEAQAIIEQLESLSAEERQAVETLIKSLARRKEDAPVVKERPKLLGALKGNLVYMAPDFDEPLDDFKEYM